MKKNKLIIGLLIAFIAIFGVYAVDFNPRGDILGYNIYDIIGFNNINTKNISVENAPVECPSGYTMTYWNGTDSTCVLSAVDGVEQDYDFAGSSFSNVGEINGVYYVNNISELNTAISNANSDEYGTVYLEYDIYTTSTPIEFKDNVKLECAKGTTIYFNGNENWINFNSNRNEIHNCHFKINTITFDKNLMYFNKTFNRYTRPYFNNVIIESNYANGSAMFFNNSENHTSMSWAKFDNLNIIGFEKGVNILVDADDGNAYVNSWQFNDFIAAGSKHFIYLNATGNNDIDGNWFSGHYQSTTETDAVIDCYNCENNKFKIMLWDLTTQSATNTSYVFDSDSKYNKVIGDYCNRPYLIDEGDRNVCDDDGRKVVTTNQVKYEGDTSSTFLMLFQNNASATQINLHNYLAKRSTSNNQLAIGNYNGTFYNDQIIFENGGVKLNPSNNEYVSIGTNSPSSNGKLIINQNENERTILITSSATSESLYEGYNNEATYSAEMFNSNIENSGASGDNFKAKNDGTGFGFLADMNGEGIGIDIDSEATTKPGLKIQDIPSDKSIVTYQDDKFCFDGLTCSIYIKYNGSCLVGNSGSGEGCITLS